MVDKAQRAYKGLNVKPDTYERLVALGHKGQSFDGIINDLIDKYEAQLKDKGVSNEKES